MNSLCTTEWVCSESGFDQLEDDWSRLHSLNSENGLFTSWYWNRLWWQHYGAGCELSILLVRIDGKIEALAPFYLCTTNVLRLKKTRTLRLIGSGGDTSPDDLNVLWNPHHSQTVLTTITKQVVGLNRLGRVQLHDVSGSSGFLDAFATCADENTWTLHGRHDQQRQVDKLPGTIEEYESALSRNGRKKRKRRRRKLAEAGNASYHLCVTPTEVQSTLDELVKLHLARHSSKGASGSFSSEQYKDFHLALMLGALRRNELRLVSLSIDSRIVGVEYAFVFNRCLLFFQSGFDPEFEYLSPGHLLMMQMIDQAIEEGVHSMDLLKGDYAYKDSYAKCRRVSTHMDYFRSRPLAYLMRIASSVRNVNRPSLLYTGSATPKGCK